MRSSVPRQLSTEQPHVKADKARPNEQRCVVNCMWKTRKQSRAAPSCLHDAEASMPAQSAKGGVAYGVPMLQ